MMDRQASGVPIVAIAAVECILESVDCFVYIFIHRKTVATQKNSSASININKTKTTTKSVTVVDTFYWSINIIYYK